MLGTNDLMVGTNGLMVGKSEPAAPWHGEVVWWARIAHKLVALQPLATSHRSKKMLEQASHILLATLCRCEILCVGLHRGWHAVKL